MDQAILIIHVVAAVALIVLILLQRSSADGGAAFGGGSQQSLLGTSGSAPLLTKITVVLAVIFFVTSLSMAYFNRFYDDGDRIIIPEVETVPSQQSQQPSITVNPVDEDIPAAPAGSETSASDVPVPEE